MIELNKENFKGRKVLSIEKFQISKISNLNKIKGGGEPEETSKTIEQ